MSEETWSPREIAQDRPNVARMYDYLLGGFHNFEADRVTSEAVMRVYPEMGPSARAHRAMLRRMVSFLAAQGIDQFLDIGSGLPTVGNVHEVAQAVNPEARVAYVDIDPVAVAHSKAMLRGNPLVGALRGDAGQPDYILGHAEVQRLLDFSRPAAILLLAVLHFVVDDEQAYGAIRTLRDVLAPGSYLAISHGTYDDCPDDISEQLGKLYAPTGSPPRYRSYSQVSAFFAGFELVEPGLVHSVLWRPDEPGGPFWEHPERTLGWVGVGRKP
jgi:hypothetical protein